MLYDWRMIPVFLMVMFGLSAIVSGTIITIINSVFGLHLPALLLWMLLGGGIVSVAAGFGLGHWLAKNPDFMN